MQSSLEVSTYQTGPIQGAKEVANRTETVYSAFTDMYLAIYPITVLLKLHMSLQKKLALSAALSLGAM
jgi:hypothetical protein